MQGPLISLPPPSSYSHRQSSSSFLKKLKRAATKKYSGHSAPRPSPISGQAAQHVVASAIAAARAQTKDPSPSKQPQVQSASSDSDESQTSFPEPLSAEEEQLQEWRHYADFELSIAVRVSDLY